MDSQKNKFYELLNEKNNKLKNDDKKDNYTISNENYQKILTVLQLQKREASCDGFRFKAWATKHFEVKQVGLTPTIYSKKMQTPIVVREKLFDTIKK